MFRFVLIVVAVSLALGQTAIADDATSQTVINLLVKQLKDRESKKRAEAAKELGELGDKAKAAARPLCEACMDVNGKVSVAAIDAIEKIRPDLHKHIITIISDPETSKHQRAFDSLARLKEEANPVVPILLVYVSRGASSPTRNAEGSCINCAKCIGAIAPEDPTIRVTLTNISRQHPGSHLTGECLVVLSNLGEAKRELRKKIYPTLLSAIATSCRLQAINGLAKFGADASDALPILKKLRFDGDEAIRNASTEAIRKIEAAK
jgi:HEAT repeat protein